MEIESNEGVTHDPHSVVVALFNASISYFRLDEHQILVVDGNRRLFLCGGSIHDLLRRTKE